MHLLPNPLVKLNGMSFCLSTFGKFCEKCQRIFCIRRTKVLEEKKSNMIGACEETHAALHLMMLFAFRLSTLQFCCIPLHACKRPFKHPVF